MVIESLSRRFGLSRYTKKFEVATYVVILDTLQYFYPCKVFFDYPLIEFEAGILAFSVLEQRTNIF